MRRLIFGLFAFSVMLTVDAITRVVFEAEPSPTDSPDVRAAASVLAIMGSRHGLDFDHGALTCHIAEQTAAWESSEAIGAMPLEVWLTFWLADDWPPEVMWDSEGMADLFERGNWREGEDPGEDLRELANRAERVGEC